MAHEETVAVYRCEDDNGIEFFVEEVRQKSPVRLLDEPNAFAWGQSRFIGENGNSMNLDGRIFTDVKTGKKYGIT